MLLHNAGSGSAQGVAVTTQQPEIIENEKGLRVAFSIDSVTLNGGTPLPARLAVQVGARLAVPVNARCLEGFLTAWTSKCTGLNCGVSLEQGNATREVDSWRPSPACAQVGTVAPGDTAMLLWAMRSTLQGSLRPRNVSITTR